MTFLPSELFAIFVVFAAIASTSGGAAYAAPRPMRRIAVIVGANSALPGRAPLRYAHEDANELATALEQVGGFDPSDVHVLLDPDAADLVAEIDRVSVPSRTESGALFSSITPAIPTVRRSFLTASPFFSPRYASALIVFTHGFGSGSWIHVEAGAGRRRKV